MRREERLRLINSMPIAHNGLVYPVAVKYESLNRASVPLDVERDDSGAILFVLPGGGRATEKQIRGLA